MTTEGPITITWLGHATTKLQDADGRVVLIDAFVDSNPVTPDSAKNLDRVDLMLLTHGHGDHTADAVSIAQKTNPTVIAVLELCAWLGTKGVGNLQGMNLGGSQTWNGIKITAVEAIHSSTVQDGDQTVDTGVAAGFVIQFPNGFTVYHAGDTAVFENMRLIGRLYHPDVALLPIGDYFTMGPKEAAEAIRLLGVTNVIPIHYGTFPVLTGTPDALKQETADIEGLKITVLNPGESVKSSDL